jgi:hypothetical protein
MKHLRATRLSPVLFLLLAFPATSRGSYVNFTGSSSSASTWTATIDGVTATATSLVGPLRLDPVFGLRVATQEEGFPGWTPNSVQSGAFTLTFSTEVTITSLDLFDYDRYGLDRGRRGDSVRKTEAREAKVNSAAQVAIGWSHVHSGAPSIPSLSRLVGSA